MKKIWIFTAIILTLLSFSIQVSAQQIQKDNIVLLEEDKVQIKVGETITLSAESFKQGSSYADEWLGAAKTATFFDQESGYYKSTARFTAKEAGIYKVTYKMVMYSGKSNVAFTKIVYKMVEVLNPVTVQGAVAKNVVFHEIKKPDGRVSGYIAVGEVYILWSDDTLSPYSSICLFFTSSETTKEIQVEIDINKNSVSYPITVSRL
ncbi:MAG: hypothetical protein N2645_18055 [Clostridia bacterium]|nr:hypothetical protein [Clostridia bacterium]